MNKQTIQTSAEIQIHNKKKIRKKRYVTLHSTIFTTLPGQAGWLAMRILRGY